MNPFDRSAKKTAFDDAKPWEAKSAAVEADTLGPSIPQITSVATRVSAQIEKATLAVVGALSPEQFRLSLSLDPEQRILYELDDEVAVEVMGWHLREVNRIETWFDGGGVPSCCYGLWNPASRVEQAMTAFQALDTRHGHFDLRLGDFGDKHAVVRTIGGRSPLGEWRGAGQSYAEAICRAVLAAKRAIAEASK